MKILNKIRRWLGYKPYKCTLGITKYTSGAARMEFSGRHTKWFSGVGGHEDIVWVKGPIINPTLNGNKKACLSVDGAGEVVRE